MIKPQRKSSGRTGTKILLEAMSKGKVHLARFVLDALDGEIVDSKTEGAQTPLISSVLLPHGQIRCKFIELLLQRGANVNCQDGSGRTALSYACEKGYLDAVKILVRNSADPEIADSWGNSALMYAAMAGQSSVVEFLVRAFKRLGVQIDRQNKSGNTAAEVAKFLGHTECIFALGNNSKKSRCAEGGATGDAQLRLSLDFVHESEKFEKKVGYLVDKLEVLRTCNHADCQVVKNCTWQTRPRIKQSRLPSMDSIEEFERADDGVPSPPQEQLVFSGVLTPKPPPRTSDHSQNSMQPKSGDHLPPLIRSCEPQKSLFFSPQPSRNSLKPSAPTALGILLTPILSIGGEDEPGTEKSNMSDFCMRRLQDSYFQKRCSLPTSVLSPTPPERSQVTLPKSRIAKRREASACKSDFLQFPAPTSASSTTAFLVSSSKLLRRFTSPEFKKHVKELEEDPELTSGRIPRSETFPQCTKHLHVDSKPSVDSISSVTCEFDFHFRMPNS